MTHTPLSVGLHEGIPAHIYHADPAPMPSLSSSLARVLINDSPRHACSQHPRLNPDKVARESTDSMDLGTLVHAILAGDRGGIEVGLFDDYRSKAARDWRDGVRATGATPVLEKHLHAANPIADAVKASIGKGCDNGPFREGVRAMSEAVAIWQEGDEYCRALVDRLTFGEHSADLWDWKTTTDVSDRAIEKTVANYGYATQLAFYLRGLRKLLPTVGQLSASIGFVEIAPPYTVRRVYFSPEYMAHADREVSRAIRLWQDCRATGDWSDPRNGSDYCLELPGYLVADDNITID
jgi:hypothetical protein